MSAAYAQQRKLTHDFRAHLSTLDGMLMQQNRDINTIQTYIHSLQSKQNERILLVNTHHAALDALLNQKALVAKNRKIDIQFSVNDLSPIKIDMVDLTVVISNTLDNAIEACENCRKRTGKFMCRHCLKKMNCFMLSVINLCR